MTDTPFYKLPLAGHPYSPDLMVGGTDCRICGKPESHPVHHRANWPKGSRSGRFSHQPSEGALDMLARRDQYMRIPFDDLVCCDFSKIERRLVAHMAVTVGIPEEILQGAQAMIDEEGCGATFAAMKNWES